jgi:hypothetical protein
MRGPVYRVHVVLDYIEGKIMEATEGPNGNDHQKCCAKRGLLDEQESSRKQT